MIAEIVRGAMMKAGLKFLTASFILARWLRGLGWLRLIIITNTLLCVGIIVLYVLRNRPIS
jgi:hypothetical protein